MGGFVCPAGAKYVVPVAEHHDGFQMYQSEISHLNAGEMGPKRDGGGIEGKLPETRDGGWRVFPQGRALVLHGARQRV